MAIFPEPGSFTEVLRLSRDPPPFVRTQPLEKPMTCRPATLADVPEMAWLACKILRFYPAHTIILPKCSIEEHIRWSSERFVRYLAQATYRVFVVFDRDGEMAGFFTWCRVGLGDTDEEDLPAVRWPESADMETITRYRAKSEAWKAEILEDHGPHIRGETMGIDLTKRRVGLASLLAKSFAEEVDRESVPVFFETCYETVPVYERYCHQNGYKLVMVDRPATLDSRNMICKYRFRMVQAEEMRNKPPPWIHASRERSPELVVGYEDV